MFLWVWPMQKAAHMTGRPLLLVFSQHALWWAPPSAARPAKDTPPPPTELYNHTRFHSPAASHSRGSWKLSSSHTRPPHERHNFDKWPDTCSSCAGVSGGSGGAASRRSSRRSWHEPGGESKSRRLEGSRQKTCRLEFHPSCGADEDKLDPARRRV